MTPERIGAAIGWVVAVALILVSVVLLAFAAAGTAALVWRALLAGWGLGSSV